jgi:hypothetical protein
VAVYGAAPGPVQMLAHFMSAKLPPLAAYNPPWAEAGAPYLPPFWAQQYVSADTLLAINFVRNMNPTGECSLSMHAATQGLCLSMQSMGAVSREAVLPYPLVLTLPSLFSLFPPAPPYPQTHPAWTCCC